MSDDLAIIQTLDFFTPMVDDPFIFGQIAAVNAINDIYAMGGKPLLAMNLVCYPQCGDLTVLRRILEGGLNKIKEAGALVVGGHTVDDNEPKFGLSVCGTVHPQKITSNRGAQPGDRLFLTKPLGTGIIATAIKAEMAAAAAAEEAVYWMSMLNRAGAEAMQEVGVNAATDITGFGLIGHVFEMAWASDVTVEINADQLGLIQGALDYASMGLIPAGTYTNRDYLADKIQFMQEIAGNLQDIMFTPETAGGLLISVAGSKAGLLKEGLEARQCRVYEIGSVLHKDFSPIRISR